MNIASPEALARLLAYMWNHPDESTRDAFIGSLAVGGQDGTLRSRFTEAPTAGNVRARTGTLTGVSALSGYVNAANGTPLAFVLICNNYTAPSRVVRDAQDDIVNLLARLSL